MNSFDVLDEKVGIFADEWLLVIAGDIVPLDAVVVDIVQHSEARLSGVVDLELGVVGLGASEVSSAAPGLGRPARGCDIGGGDFLVRV